MELTSNVKLNKFDYLDSNDIQDYVFNGKTKEFRLFVEGIKCSRCVNKLEAIPLSYTECISSRVDFGKKELTVQLTPNGKISDIATKLSSLGFSFKLIAKDDSLEQERIKEKRKDLKRIAVTGFCAAQLMVYSFGIYFGVQDNWLSVFKWLNFILFLPIIFYSAIPFYKGSLLAFKNKIIHIDLPITIALLSGFFLSTYNLLIGSKDFYFDSTAGFIFLILVARFFVNKTQENFLSSKKINLIPLDELYQITDGNYKTSHQIKTDDIFLVKRHQLLPTDCVLVSNDCIVDTSLLSGESEPKVFHKGLTLLAGNKVISESAKLQALRPYKDSRLFQLTEQSFSNLISKNNYLSQSDRLAQKLITTVFTVSLLFFILYGLFTNNFTESFNRVLALLVVACPCALAFGAPLTLSQAFAYAKEKGIFIRNANVFEKLNDIKNVFFDKTGTLTSGKLEIVQTWPESLDLKTINILLNLEQISYHPIAFSIREKWSSIFLPLDLKNHSEFLGKGINAKIDDDLYEIKSLSDNLHSDDYAVALFKNKEVIARLYFKEKLLVESLDIIQYLKNHNINCYLVSGDKKQKCIDVARTCKIPTENVFYDLFPEDKERIISNYNHSAMIGDGHNDMLALSKSDVGIVVSSCSQTTLSTADIYFTKSGLKPFLDLLKINEITKNTLERNLFLSLLYNLTAGTCALLGLINPLIAALLMPLSTGLVLLSTLWGYRK